VQREIDEPTITIRDFNFSLSQINGKSQKGENKDIVELNNIINELDKIDFCRLPYPKIAECTFFSRSHGAFAEEHHMVGHKVHHNKFKRIEFIKYLTDHTRIKPEINNRKISGRSQKYMESK
jgi:hypothetical protein